MLSKGFDSLPQFKFLIPISLQPDGVTILCFKSTQF